MSKHKSRRRTPWEEKVELTASQEFLKHHYELYYADRHRKVEASGEAEMINSYIPLNSRYCEAEKFKKSGYTKSGIQRYMCSECVKNNATCAIADKQRHALQK